MLNDLVNGSRHFHPNRLSVYGLAAAVGSVVASVFDESRVFAPAIYAFGAGLDWADGYVARATGAMTKEGAVLDPMCDKLKHICIFGLMAYNTLSGESNLSSETLVGAAALGVTVDAVSQSMRGNLINQFGTCARSYFHPEKCTVDNEIKSNVRANIYGKAKTTLQNISHFAYLSLVGYHEELRDIFGKGFENKYLNGLAGILMVSALLGGVGILRRRKLRKK